MGNEWGCLRLHLVFASIFLVASTLNAQNKTVGCSEQERLALFTFKYSIKYDFKMLTSWVGDDCCLWEGVGCDGVTGSIVSLHLRGNCRGWGSYDSYLEEDYYLVGDDVNPSLADLMHLRHLDLSGNYFQGSRIPEFIGSFKQLRYLNLSNAGFSGNIPPHIGNLSNLKVLDLDTWLYQSWIESDDLAWVSSLPLEYLDLSYVDLVGAQNTDKVFYSIPSLTVLNLRGSSNLNAIFGPHVNSSRPFPNIKHLDLSSSFFLHGQISILFQNMTSLSFLDLSLFDLSLAWNSGNLLIDIPSLSELHLSSCGIHNTHLSPTNFNFSTRSNIQHLDLSHNLIEGIFPPVLTNMTSLRVLDLSQNSLNSSIPFMLNLMKLDLSYNSFEQFDHIGIWRQCHLKKLSLTGNYLGEEMIGPSTNMSECSHYDLEMLNLDENQLMGSIPDSLGRLTNLRVLNLRSNRLTGPIPEAIGKLRSLQGLNLAYNQFKGPIPEILGRLTTLTDLLLQSNQLTGPIPASLGRLTLLKEFSVASNLLNGTIPFSVGQLANLVYLDISYNSLEGVVSEANFADLSMLKYLDTTSNLNLIFNFSHEWIPPFQLKTVRLGSCKIAGDFPQWFQTQRKIEELVLSNASISGPLPTWFRKMPVIPVLDLSHNNLTGPLINLPLGDRFLGLNEFGQRLFLQGNLFGGSIPTSLCRRTNLQLLDVSRNRLSGKIPECVENLQYLIMLMLSSNVLSGVLPGYLGNVSSSLVWLQLNDNKFYGELPRSLGNLGSLRVLDLGENEFTGNIPKWLGENLGLLIVLRLHKNNFTGGILQSLCKKPHLQILDVAHNNLTGHIPHCFGELTGMINHKASLEGVEDFRDGISSSHQNLIQVLNGAYLEYSKTLDLVFNMDLSSNKLTGEIPQELTTLTLLVGLNLSNNHLSGKVPYNIGNMKALNSLDLSQNKLTGMIPPGMAALNFLSHLNLSHNNLSGRIPTGNQLQTLTDPSIYAGNRDLCGVPLTKNCSNHVDLTTTPDTNKNKASDEPMVLFYLDILCGFVTGFWGIIGVLVLKKRWRQKLFMFSEATIDKIHNAVMVRVIKLKTRTQAEDI